MNPTTETDTDTETGDGPGDAAVSQTDTTWEPRHDDYGESDGRWREVDWPAHTHALQCDGVEVNYVEYGEDRDGTVLLVHGLSGSWQNWLDNICFLGDRLRVVAVDLPGFGGTSMPPWDITVPRYGTHLDRVCKELDIDRAAVVGNSLGGFIAAEMAHATPERVGRLVLVSPAGKSHAHMASQPAVALTYAMNPFRRVVAGIGPNLVSRPRARWLAWRWLLHQPKRVDPALLYESARTGIDAKGTPQALDALLGYDFHDRLEDITAPTLMVWGNNDHVVPTRDAAGYLEMIPHARLMLFDKTGHMPMLERSTRFNRLMFEFFEQSESPSTAVRQRG